MTYTIRLKISMRLILLLVFSLQQTNVLAKFDKIPHEMQSNKKAYANEINENFSYLLNRLVPIGAIIAWHKSMMDGAELPEEWVECNGQILEDSESIFNGKVMPDLNSSGMFLRGSNNSGEIQNDEFKSHDHTASSKNAGSHIHTGMTTSNGAHYHSGTTDPIGNHYHSGSSTSSNGSHYHTGTTNMGEAMDFYVSQTDGNAYNLYYMQGHKSGIEGVLIKNSSNYAMAAHKHSFQTSSTPNHSHSVTIKADGSHSHKYKTSTIQDHNHTLTINNSQDHKHEVTVDQNGGSETRPKNMSVIWIIRIK